MSDELRVILSTLRTVTEYIAPWVQIIAISLIAVEVRRMNDDK